MATSAGESRYKSLHWKSHFLFSGDIGAKETTVYACSGTPLVLQCSKPNHVIQITRANYGRFSIAVCNEEGEWENISFLIDVINLFCTFLFQAILFGVSTASLLAQRTSYPASAISKRSAAFLPVTLTLVQTPALRPKGTWRLTLSAWKGLHRRQVRALKFQKHTSALLAHTQKWFIFFVPAGLEKMAENWYR